MESMNLNIDYLDSLLGSDQSRKNLGNFAYDFVCARQRSEREQKWLDGALVMDCAFRFKYTRFDPDQENFFRSIFQGIEGLLESASCY